MTKQQRARAATPLQPHLKQWESLTWDDVANWAGDRSLSRGRTYHRQHRVHELALSSDGRLLATVIGGTRYAVSVRCEAEALRSRCTCPVGWDGCKHAVATVAAYLELLARGGPVPEASPDDPRWRDAMANGEKGEGDAPEAGEGTVVESTSNARISERTENENIRRYIEGKSRKELVVLILSIATRLPELREEFRARIALGQGDTAPLVAQVRQELHRVTSKPGWRNNWSGEGFTPDYGRLKARLERMVELGHADAVMQFGKEIIRRGMEQIGQSDDEGETASAFTECLPVIFSAAANSSLPPAKKILFAIDAHLADEYGLIEQPGVDVVLEGGEFQSLDWSKVADEMARRLKAAPRAGEDFTARFGRDRICNWLIRGLKNAGREDEILPLCEQEARNIGSYERLVNLLIERERYDDAEQWATEGIRKNAGKCAGIASRLAQMMTEVARLRRKWKIVAAHAAAEFFADTSREKFEKLIADAERAGCRGAVQRLALEFLESGKSPISVAAGRDGSQTVVLSKDWPLPISDYLLPLMRTSDGSPVRPHYNVLIDMAIASGQPDDALRWYDKWHAELKQSTSIWTSGSDRYGDRVAAAVVSSQPERALEIYRQRVDSNLLWAHVSSYETATEYLRKMLPILKSLDRDWEWKEMVAGIRVRYRNRPRFMEMLDRLDARPILGKRREQN
jgi:uncharacterized Zn finger protein